MYLHTYLYPIFRVLVLYSPMCPDTCTVFGIIIPDRFSGLSPHLEWRLVSVAGLHVQRISESLVPWRMGITPIPRLCLHLGTSYMLWIISRDFYCVLIQM